MARAKKKTKAYDVITLVDELLERAIIAEASDIHFEPTSRSLQIKYRLDGQLQVMEELPAALAENVLARLKVLAGLLTYRTDIPQEGRIDLAASDAPVVSEMRLAVFPTINGQRAVIRLFYQHGSLQNLDQLGVPPEVHEVLQSFVAKNQGILLFTGPAGSGKSTTLAALMRMVLEQTPGRSVVTVEDPVEIRIEGAAQVQIPPHGELTFATALRSLLRQDPQVLMLGEIRDAETARIAIEAGLTGHLLASTMHSGSPAGALIRLLEMGLEPYQVTSSVVAVVNQRLVRRLCNHCKQQEATRTFVAQGCEHCLHTGYHGRLLLAEVLSVDERVRQALLRHADITQLAAPADEHGQTALQRAGRRLLTQGLTTETELQRVGGMTPSC